MNVVINGKNITLEKVSNVAELVEERNVTGMFVIEQNKEIVQKENYAQSLIAENDSFEIVGFFGGG